MAVTLTEVQQLYLNDYPIPDGFAALMEGMARLSAEMTQSGKLLSAEDKGGGRWLIKHELTVEIEGGEKPALIAEWIAQVFV